MMFITSISTHTPLAGRDAIVFDEMPDEFDFYSHAPCGARRAIIFFVFVHHNFYSHAPCGARLRNSA